MAAPLLLLFPSHFIIFFYRIAAGNAIAHHGQNQHQCLCCRRLIIAHSQKKFVIPFFLFIFTIHEPHFIVCRRNFCTALLRM